LQGEGAGALVVWWAVVTVFRVGAGRQAVGSAAGHPSARRCGGHGDLRPWPGGINQSGDHAIRG